jgi:hypothetical protein
MYQSILCDDSYNMLHVPYSYKVDKALITTPDPDTHNERKLVQSEALRNQGWSHQ